MAVDVTTAAKFEAGIPKALFNVQMLRTATSTGYAATADGKRFLIATTGDEESASAPFHVVLNWKPARP